MLQIIMVRLQRVTFLALHNYLGLTTELFNPVGGKLISACIFVRVHTHSHTHSHTHTHTHRVTQREWISQHHWLCLCIQTSTERHIHTRSHKCKLISHNIKHSIMTRSFIKLSKNEWKWLQPFHRKQAGHLITKYTPVCVCVCVCVYVCMYIKYTGNNLK